MDDTAYVLNPKGQKEQPTAGGYTRDQLNAAAASLSSNLEAR